MHFGLTNAPSTFQADMNYLLRPLSTSVCSHFFNDIRIYSSNLEDHIVHLKTILQVLQHKFFSLS